MPQILPLRHLFLQQGIIFDARLPCKPGAIGWIPEVGGLVSGPSAFVKLRSWVGLCIGHTDMAPFQAWAHFSRDGWLRGCHLQQRLSRSNSGGQRGWRRQGLLVILPFLAWGDQQRRDSFRVFWAHWDFFLLLYAWAIFHRQSSVDDIRVLQERTIKLVPLLMFEHCYHSAIMQDGVPLQTPNFLYKGHLWNTASSGVEHDSYIIQ